MVKATKPDEAVQDNVQEPEPQGDKKKKVLASKNKAEMTETSIVLKALEQKLGRLIYRIGRKQQEINDITEDIKKLQIEANKVATAIEGLENGE